MNLAPNLYCDVFAAFIFHVFYLPLRDTRWRSFSTSRCSKKKIAWYRVDPQTGELALQGDVPVPDDYQGGACARMELHPSGRFLYATNRGHDSLAGFRIDPQSGALESIGQFPTEENPRSFHFDPQGRFLYAAGESNDRLRAYRLDDQSGALDPLHTYETGHVPWWVQVVEPG